MLYTIIMAAAEAPDGECGGAAGAEVGPGLSGRSWGQGCVLARREGGAGVAWLGSGGPDGARADASRRPGPAASAHLPPPS